MEQTFKTVQVPLISYYVNKLVKDWFHGAYSGNRYQRAGHSRVFSKLYNIQQI